MGPIILGQEKIGSDCPCYIVAEMSGNHNGDIDIAKKIIEKAKECGANAVKLQTYTADTITLNCDGGDFRLPENSPWSSFSNLHQLYHKAHTPWGWHRELFEYARSLDIEIFSAPFDETAVDFLEEMNCPAYKIASPEIFHVPLLRRVAKTGKPVIISTGLATYDDIDLAVSTLRAEGCESIIILKCTTSYPAPLSEANLSTIKDIPKKFNCWAGLSDHTKGLIAPLTAVALGAVLIEKHFTISEAGESVDSFFSLDEVQFRELVLGVRDVENSVGSVTYELSEKARENLSGRRSIYVAENIQKGEFFSKENIKVVRPGHGLHPKYYEEVLGKKAKVALCRGDRLSWGLIE